MTSRLAIYTLCTLAVALRPMAAQSDGGPVRTTVVSRCAGLQEVDGQLQGAGDGYKVTFLPRGFEFTPALGDGAPRNQPLTFELLSIGRGTATAPLSAAAPRHQGRRVEYDRGVAIERYDVEVDHLEQSFVFAERPAGTGDLVVRGRFTTDLTVTAEGDGLRFTLPSVGGFTMGGVTGVGADGQRTRGQVRYASGIVELSLPAEFVDSAALPFVLDPPFAGASVVSGTGGADDRSPTVAYDATNDVYLAVWERVFSATDHDVYAHFVNRSIVPTGTMLFVETTTSLATAPQVANCNARDAFVVVFMRGVSFIGRAVNAATGLMGSSLTIATSTVRTEAHAFGCVAGDTVSPQVMCVWQYTDSSATASRSILAASLGIDPNLALTRRAVQTVASSLSISRPRVSKSERGSGRYAVVYERLSAAGPADPAMRIINTSGTAISNELLMSVNTVSETMPEVDGDGATWVAAWQFPPTSLGATVTAATVSFDPASGQLARNAINLTVATLGFAGNAEFPRVTCLADSCVVGYTEQLAAATTRSAHVVSLEPFTCSSCEGAFQVGVSSRVEGPPSGCSVRTGGGTSDTSDDALFVWEQVLSGNGDIVARGWRTVDGDVTSLGGGCGRGGTNRASCARSPSAAFSLRLRDALAAAPTVFLLSGSQSSVPCGACNLIPDLTGALLLPVNTDTGGEVRLPMSIPSLSPLVGVALFTQWITVDLNAPACTQFSVHLSDALRIVIER